MQSFLDFWSSIIILGPRTAIEYWKCWWLFSLILFYCFSVCYSTYYANGGIAGTLLKNSILLNRWTINYHKHDFSLKLALYPLKQYLREFCTVLSWVYVILYDDPTIDVLATEKTFRMKIVLWWIILINVSTLKWINVVLFRISHAR